MCSYPGCEEDHLAQCPACGEIGVEEANDEFECQACGHAIDGLCPEPTYPIEEYSRVNS